MFFFPQVINGRKITGMDYYIFLFDISYVFCSCSEDGKGDKKAKEIKPKVRCMR